eukprot:TRINITY_DN39607_c0_g1_i1.p1 TRINITY_DN39607_c0_g1~~TRINITY_DN39607_c0_g1_i1.p1  ORF type:complete len:478 (+),score=77.49 TRINITY_DN39607_c0_g1_i1:43-1434(+)
MVSDAQNHGLLLAGGIVGAGMLLWIYQQQSRKQKSQLNNSASGGAAVKESTIRLMTRLAIQHGAVNLSQGFPNEPPPVEMARAAAGALLAGSSLEAAEAMAKALENGLPRDEKDLLSQYSFPFGLPLLRQELQKYYARYYPGLAADAEENLTVVLGATEGFACTLRTICAPGDRVVFFEPFHELYPSQCKLWHLEPRAVTLRENGEAGEWQFRREELDDALRGAKLLLLNTPHNPTGKVFSSVELRIIAELCIRHDVICVTDEIYEHIVFDDTPRVPPCMALQPGMAERTFVVNAVSKTARATGWRVGWVVSPSKYTHALRGVHDQLVLQAPTPLQYGAAALLRLPDEYFASLGEEYSAKRDVLLPALKSSGFRIQVHPRGAYYIFADYTQVSVLKGLSPTEAAMKMTRDIGVACVPGDNFYLGDARSDPNLGGRYLRFAYVRSHDLLEQAISRMKAQLVANR